jgi:hypothetical protein
VTSPFSLVVTWQSYKAILTSVGGSGVLLSSHETASSVPRSRVRWNASRTVDSAREDPLPKPQPARAATTTRTVIVIAFTPPLSDGCEIGASPRKGSAAAGLDEISDAGVIGVESLRVDAQRSRGPTKRHPPAAGRA